tara:strand:+ start:946 stop:1326 length:381 start_codon:yes stop_codon:yes gene_type:complete
VKKFLNISQVSEVLNLVHPITKKPLNHIIRYWEKEFRVIRAKKINNRKYYSQKQVEIIKMIKFLLRNKGLTIAKTKSLINFNVNKLDDYDKGSLKAEYYRNLFNLKSKNILEKINKIKSYGKKNSS